MSTMIIKQIIKFQDEFDATEVHSTLNATKQVTIPPIGCKQIKGVPKIKGHTMRVHVVVEPIEDHFNDS